MAEKEAERRPAVAEARGLERRELIEARRDEDAARERGPRRERVPVEQRRAVERPLHDRRDEPEPRPHGEVAGREESPVEAPTVEAREDQHDGQHGRRHHRGHHHHPHERRRDEVRPRRRRPHHGECEVEERPSPDIVAMTAPLRTRNHQETAAATTSAAAVIRRAPVAGTQAAPLQTNGPKWPFRLRAPPSSRHVMPKHDVRFRSTVAR